MKVYFTAFIQSYLFLQFLHNYILHQSFSITGYAVFRWFCQKLHPESASHCCVAEQHLESSVNHPSRPDPAYFGVYGNSSSGLSATVKDSFCAPCRCRRSLFTHIFSESSCTTSRASSSFRERFSGIKRYTVSA